MASPNGRRPRAIGSEQPVPETKTQNTLLDIRELVIDPRLQMRVTGTDNEHADDLARVIKKRGKVPRIKVRHVEGIGNLVTDGFHTVEGYKRAGKQHVPVALKTGTYEEAIADAAGANRGHLALKRTNADRRRAVQVMVVNFPNWSNRKIAVHVGVGDDLVEDIRTTLQVSLPTPDAVIGLDGKHYHKAPKALIDPVIDSNRRSSESDETADPVVAAAKLTDQKAEQPCKAKERTFDWREFDRHLGWLARSVDTLAGLTGKNAELEKAHGALNDFLKLVNECRKQLTGKSFMDPPDRRR